MNFPVVTGNGDVVTIGELAEGEQVVSAATIRRINGARTITLRVTPPKDQSLEQAIAVLKNKVEPSLAPMMSNNTQIVYEGTAASLGTALTAMTKNVLLAILILYLVIAALFSSLQRQLVCGADHFHWQQWAASWRFGSLTCSCSSRWTC